MVKAITACIVSSLVAVGFSASAQSNPNIQPMQNHQGPNLPPGYQAKLQICRPDPAIVSVTLTKGPTRRDVQVSYTIANVGTSQWRSTPSQQHVALTVHNANAPTNRSYTSVQLPGFMSAPGAVMLSFTTPMITNAFDDSEFGGYLDLSIDYQPSVWTDDHDFPCNNDANLANNHFRLEGIGILDFVKGPLRSKTYRP